jgi:hypothetical protein
MPRGGLYRLGAHTNAPQVNKRFTHKEILKNLPPSIPSVNNIQRLSTNLSPPAYNEMVGSINIQPSTNQMFVNNAPPAFNASIQNNSSTFIISSTKSELKKRNNSLLKEREENETKNDDAVTFGYNLYDDLYIMFPDSEYISIPNNELESPITIFMKFFNLQKIVNNERSKITNYEFRGTKLGFKKDLTVDIYILFIDNDYHIAIVWRSGNKSAFRNLQDQLDDMLTGNYKTHNKYNANAPPSFTIDEDMEREWAFMHMSQFDEAYGPGAYERMRKKMINSNKPELTKEDALYVVGFSSKGQQLHNLWKKGYTPNNISKHFPINLKKHLNEQLKKFWKLEDDMQLQKGYFSKNKKKGGRTHRRRRTSRRSKSRRSYR